MQFHSDTTLDRYRHRQRFLLALKLLISTNIMEYMDYNDRYVIKLHFHLPPNPDYPGMVKTNVLDLNF